MSNSGADFLLGDVGLKPKKTVKIHNSGDLDVDAAVAMFDMKKDGEALRGGLDRAISALDALKKTGLTGEALVVLVQAKCKRPSSGGKPATRETVQAVLEGLFRLGEYVR